MNAVSYTAPPPPDYHCHRCQVAGVKLWREYQTCAPTLLCVACACADQKKVDNVDARGYRYEPDDHEPRCMAGMRSDQIGWYVPAVPDEEGLGYWGYTSVPEAGVEWWRALPTRAGAANPA
jgi:hypothetical protein